MDIKEFMINHDVEQCANCIDTDVLREAEKKLDIKFGEELCEYLLKYGYLAYGCVELYGMNSRQNLNSDMVLQTLYLHKYFPATMPYIAIENQGEGDYYLIDSQDNIYRYISEKDELIKTDWKLGDYVVHRFKDIDVK